MKMQKNLRWDNLRSRLSPDQRQAMDFLLAHLPKSDLDCYPPELFLQFVDHALFLRKTAAWCAELDWEIFTHYVLFPRVNDEDITFHRAIFYEALWPRVKDLPSLESKVLEVNRWCHEHASYQVQDDRTASPLTVYRCGSGRCGEESAFLTSALRSIGIAARQVYAPRWSHCDDNHAWVEALCGDTWHFLGACEPEPVLDRGWFITAASRAMLVHSRTFGEAASTLHGTYISQEGAVRWFNQTARYARTRIYTFRALVDGKPAPGAVFCLGILNEAWHHTIIRMMSDGAGMAQIELGVGTIHVTALWNGLFAEDDCTGEDLTLILHPMPESGTPWQDFDVQSPEISHSPPSSLTIQQKSERTAVLQHGNTLREARIAAFAPPKDAPYMDILCAARGNIEALQTYLSGPEVSRRVQLLHTLSNKDLRDISPEILEDHLLHLPPCPEGLPENIYWQYVACPRIALEKITAWRGSLRRWLADWKGSPAMLWHYLRELLADESANSYRNLYWTPVEILEAGGCDEKSLRILLIASLRALGFPARLRTLDGEPEVWECGVFHTVRFQETGVLSLSNFALPWSLSRWTGEEWQLLTPEFLITSDVRCLALPSGYYRLITSLRLPNGNQFASRKDFALRPDMEVTISLRNRTCDLQDMLSRRPLPALTAETLDGRTIPDLFHQDGPPALVLWLEEGTEPTAHVLNELTEYRQTLDALPVRVTFLIRSRESLQHPVLSALLADWRRVQVLLSDWSYDLETVARHLGHDPETPPLAVVCDSAGQAVCSFGGYRAGGLELLVRVAEYLSQCG